MKCAHCLRGEPQNKTMQLEYLRSFMSQVECVSCVTFTGGEPTLPSGMQVIREFMGVCREFEVGIESFYMATNAKKWRPELPRLISDLYNFCGDNEISCVDISTDQFHDPIARQREDFYHKLTDVLDWDYGITNIVDQRMDIEYSNVLSEGRGLEFMAGNPYHHIGLEIDKDRDTYTVRDGEVYVNCKGNVIVGCDWSYESQDNPAMILCSVDDDLKTAVANELKHQLEAA